MKYVAAYAPLLEKIFIVGLLVGALLYIVQIEPFDATVTIVSLFGLGAAYYFSAFHPIENLQEEPESMTFNELLKYRVLPKVLWIGSAVSVIGFGMLVMGSATKSYDRMLVSGGLAIGAGLVITIALSLAGTPVLKAATAPLLRAVPLLIADMYFVMQ